MIQIIESGLQPLSFRFRFFSRESERASEGTKRFFTLKLVDEKFFTFNEFYFFFREKACSVKSLPSFPCNNYDSLIR